MSKTYPLAYAVTLALAALMYALGDFVALFTILASFGSPVMLLYFAVDWFVPPLVAFACGYGARRSAPRAWLLGYPLVALVTFVTPVASTKHQVLAVPVPWLAAYRAAKDEVLAAMPERLAWVSIVFLAAVLAGAVHRWIADRRAGAEGEIRSGAATAALIALPLVAAAAIAGAWRTHEEGLWGANPRTPVAANFLPIRAPMCGAALRGSRTRISRASAWRRCRCAPPSPTARPSATARCCATTSSPGPAISPPRKPTC